MNEVSQKTKQIYLKYINLPFKVKGTAVPYYKNSSLKSDIAVFVGKGSPDEIVEEAYNFARVENINIDSMNNVEIRDFLISHNLGIDCSGFVSNILAVEEKLDRVYIEGSFLRRFLAKRKMRENISVKVLTNEQNSYKIDNWREVKPYDLIITRKRKHVLLVSRVEKDEEEKIRYIYYWHATLYYEKGGGVREGKIEVVDLEADLKKQKWLEIDERGRNYTLEGFLDDDGSNGIYRLRFLSD